MTLRDTLGRLFGDVADERTVAAELTVDCDQLQETVENAGGVTVPLEQDVYHHLAGVERRRWVVYAVAEDGLTTLGELAEQQAERESAGPGQPTGQDYKRARINLYQNHLPKLAEYSVIEYDERNYDVVATAYTEPMAALLRRDAACLADGGEQP